MVETTGGFTSEGLALEASTLILSSLTQAEAIEIGEIAQQFARERALPVAIEVRMKEWIVFHVSLPGEGEMLQNGKRVPAAAALQQAGITQQHREAVFIEPTRSVHRAGIAAQQAAERFEHAGSPTGQRRGGDRHQSVRPRDLSFA